MRIICTQCNKTQTRIRKHHIFVGDTGTRWQSSKICHKCYAKNNRVIKDDLIGPELSIYYTSKKCDKCQDVLELSRYKTCIKCKPSIGSEGEPIQYKTIWESLDFRISEMSLLAGGNI